jgi:hypothetical protein
VSPEQLAVARLRERAEIVDRFLADNEGEREGWLSSMPVEAMKRDAEEFRSAADLLDAQAEEIERLKRTLNDDLEVAHKMAIERDSLRSRLAEVEAVNEMPLEVVHIDEHRTLATRLAEADRVNRQAEKEIRRLQETERSLVTRLKEDEHYFEERVVEESFKRIDEIAAKLAESQAREARLASALRKAAEWSAGYPLGGTMDDYVAREVCDAATAALSAPASEALDAIRATQRHLRECCGDCEEHAVLARVFGEPEG